MEAEQQIDLGSFYKEYIRPGLIANVVAEVESPSAKLHVSRLSSIERNLHPLNRHRWHALRECEA